MNAVFDWVKSIVFYLIFLTVVTHLIPNKKYEKYIRLFTGMILVMLVIKPVTEVFSWNEVFEQNFMKFLGENGEIGWKDEVVAGELQDVQKTQMLKEYEQQVEAYAVSEAKKLGIVISRFQAKIKWEEGVIMPERIGMEATVEQNEQKLEQITIADIIIEEREGDDTEAIEKLRKILAEYYGMEENQIQIVGR